jgi:hypothetical protein
MLDDVLIEIPRRRRWRLSDKRAVPEIDWLINHLIIEPTIS